jgi:hypothetical protein
MSIQEIVHPILRLFNTPAEIVPQIGAVIMCDGFTGTYAGTDADSFGVEYHSVVSAFEQRHFITDQFQWTLVYGEVR